MKRPLFTPKSSEERAKRLCLDATTRQIQIRVNTFIPTLFSFGRYDAGPLFPLPSTFQTMPIIGMVRIPITSIQLTLSE